MIASHPDILLSVLLRLFSRVLWWVHHLCDITRHHIAKHVLVLVIRFLLRDDPILCTVECKLKSGGVCPAHFLLLAPVFDKIVERFEDELALI